VLAGNSEFLGEAGFAGLGQRQPPSKDVARDRDGIRNPVGQMAGTEGVILVRWAVNEKGFIRPLKT
jgi:hypothetical protein